MLLINHGHRSAQALMLNQDSKLTIAGMTAQQWLKRYYREYAADTGIEITQERKPEGMIYERN